MKLFKKFSQKQFSSVKVRWVLPILALPILGIASGSFGYYISQNQSLNTWKTFSQDSKAVAQELVEPPIPSEIAPGEGAGVSKSPLDNNDFINSLRTGFENPPKVDSNEDDNLGETYKRIDDNSQQNTLPINLLGKSLFKQEEFQAIVPTGVGIKKGPRIYRFSGQCVELGGDCARLELGRIYDIVGVDTQANFLKLRDGNYIRSKEVLCNVPAICAGEIRAVNSDPVKLAYAVDVMNSQPQEILQIGW